MFKKPHYIAAGLMVLLALVLLNLPPRATARMKLALGSLFLPLFGLASGAQSAVTASVNATTSRAELLRQTESLRRENEQLKLQLLQAQATAQADARVREQLGRLRAAPWNRKLAQVIARDPANWWRSVTIDLGSRHGLRVDLPVLVADGLVGKISSVSADRAQVVLLGDPSCKVAAVVENAARDQGVLGVAGGPFDGALVQLDYLARSAGIKPGQRVLTSGDGGVFPKGIPIGTVAEARPAGSGMFLQAQVKLSANLAGLEEVWVLLP
jgi:rod shape-determining protein MreC